MNAPVMAPASRTRTLVRSFSTLSFANNCVRTVALLLQDGREPLLAVSWFRNRRPAARFMWRASELGPLEAAVEHALGGHGSRDFGEVTFTARAAVSLVAHARDDDRHIAFWRTENETGSRLWGITVVRGDELQALRSAIDELKRLSKGSDQ